MTGGIFNSAFSLNTCLQSWEKNHLPESHCTFTLFAKIKLLEPLKCKVAKHRFLLYQLHAPGLGCGNVMALSAPFTSKLQTIAITFPGFNVKVSRW